MIICALEECQVWEAFAISTWILQCYWQMIRSPVGTSKVAGYMMYLVSKAVWE